MRHTRRVKFVVFCLIASATCAGTAGANAAGATIPAGKWGGEHAVLEVSDRGASIQLDCAHGSISAAIVLDAEGRFDVAGDFAKEHGGPIRKGETESRLSARYHGRVKSRTMTLTIDVAGEGEALGPFALERGSEGHLVRCR